MEDFGFWSLGELVFDDTSVANTNSSGSSTTGGGYGSSGLGYGGPGGGSGGISPTVPYAVFTYPEGDGLSDDNEIGLIGAIGGIISDAVSVGIDGHSATRALRMLDTLSTMTGYGSQGQVDV